MDRIGRYKIVRELGRGAMGVVYHAIDPNIGRPVAIKTIQLTGARAPEEQARLRERLFREARSAQMPLPEFNIQFASLQINAREMGGGAIIFLSPNIPFTTTSAT